MSSFADYTQRYCKHTQPILNKKLRFPATFRCNSCGTPSLCFARPHGNRKLNSGSISLQGDYVITGRRLQSSPQVRWCSPPVLFGMRESSGCTQTKRVFLCFTRDIFLGTKTAAAVGIFGVFLVMPTRVIYLGYTRIRDAYLNGVYTCPRNFFFCFWNT